MSDDFEISAAELSALIASGTATPAEARAWLAGVLAAERLRVATGIRLAGSRMGADVYLDLIAVVLLGIPRAAPTSALAHGNRALRNTLSIELGQLSLIYGRDPEAVLARVALAWGGFVPEVEQP